MSTIKRKKRIGLYGGTFDPIHVGHIACAEQTRIALGLDEVIFIPTFHPVFKRNQFVTPAHHRVKMVELAIKDNPFFKLDTREVNRGGDTYTVDTLRSYVNEDKESHFFFICGADAILTLPKWKNANELVKLATFVGVERPGSSSLVDSEEVKKLHSFSSNIELIKIDAIDVSSSGIRNTIAKGEPIAGMVCNSVENYIMKHALYTKAFELSEFAYAKTNLGHISFDNDAYSKNNFHAMKLLLKQRVKPSRFEHSLMVAKTAKKIAKAYNYDSDKARMAGLLHDWDKALTKERLECRIEDYNIQVSPDAINKYPQILHGMTAACVLRDQFPWLGEDIFQAIDRHTIADPHMDTLDMIIFCADKLEPSHHVEVYDKIAKKIGKVSLEELFFEVHKAGLAYLIASDRPLNALSVDVWNYYLSHK